MQNKKKDFTRLSHTLALVSYESVLARGFALVRDENARPVRSIAAIKPGIAYTVQLADGESEMIGAGAKSPQTRKPKPMKPENPGGSQGDLF